MTNVESLVHLRESGIDQRHAEAILEVVERSHNDFVTKADLAAAIAQLEAKIDIKIGDLRREMSELKAEMSELRGELIAKISEVKLAIWVPFILLLASQVILHFWK